MLQEVNWIREYGHKMCPSLRKWALNWYRPARYMPCFLNQLALPLKQRFGKIPVIIQIDDTAVKTLSVQSLAKGTGCRVKRDLPLIQCFATDASVKTIKSLLISHAVKRIWYDGEVRAVLDIAAYTIRSDHLWDENLTGKGVTIAILDTGIYKHPDLKGRIVGFQDYIKKKSVPYDDNGHGTHVAGCAAGSGIASGGKYRAPAPGASLVGVKVLNKIGSGSLSTVILGIQWCVQNKNLYGIKVMNLSLGSDTTRSAKDDPVCLAVKNAWESGITVLAAAGNSGPDPQTVGSPGTEPAIITVGAIDDLNTVNPADDRVASFSSRGPTVDGLRKPDVCSPGVSIIALRSPGSFIDKQNRQSRVGQYYASLSGTSMATPVCAGLAAQLLEKDNTLTPEKIKKLLAETARPLPGYDQNSQGNGVVDGKSALSKLKEI